MPLERDYEFGRRAVSAGHLKQDQLEEMHRVLVALERVGSKQRLWLRTEGAVRLFRDAPLLSS